MMKPNSGVGNPALRYAWFLLTCPVRPLRDPRRAVDFFRPELNGGIARSKPRAFSLLKGLAAYRIGDWKESLKRVKPSRDLDGKMDGWYWLVQAAALWQSGEKKAARESYATGVRWLEKNRPTDLDLRRFREEAAALMGGEQNK
jgi:hypothetical protein